ncbi:hypothetical protein ACI2L4_03495 [Streptomyces sparsogenes]
MYRILQLRQLAPEVKGDENGVEELSTSSYVLCDPPWTITAP